MNDDKAGQTPATMLPISVGAATEIGHREQNQDSMSGFASPVGTAYIVADGMGGYRGGAEASRMVTESITRHLLATPESTPICDALTLAVRFANLEILEKSKSGDPEFAGMGSTVAIAVIRRSPSGLELTTAHVGDSRIYLQRDGHVDLLTKDHTQVQWLIDSHALDEAAARSHPDASILTRAIGHTTNLEIDCSDPIPLSEGDGILLCSDGLSGFANGDQIARTIRDAPDPTSCATELIQLALACGSNDNITVQFLRIGRVMPPPHQGPRKTQAEAPVLAAPRARSTAARVLAPVAVAVLVVIGAFGWERLHRPITVGADPALDELSNTLTSLRNDTIDLQTKAREGGVAAQSKLTDLKKLPGQKPASLRKSLDELNKQFATLKTDFEQLQTDSDPLLQETNEALGDLRNLTTPAARAQSKLDRQTPTGPLANRAGSIRGKLDDLKKKLIGYQNRRAGLEDDASTLKSLWNGAKGGGRGGRAGSSSSNPSAPEGTAKEKDRMI